MLRAGRRAGRQGPARKLPEMGLVGLTLFDLGFPNVTNSKRAVMKPEDLDGIKLRVIPNLVS